MFGLMFFPDRHKGFHSPPRTQTQWPSIRVAPSIQSMTYTSIDNFWDNMELGSAPIVLLKQKTSAAEWPQKVALAKQHVPQTVPSSPFTLASTAWIGTAPNSLNPTRPIQFPGQKHATHTWDCCEIAPPSSKNILGGKSLRFP